MSIDEGRSGYFTKDELVSHMLDPLVDAYLLLLQISKHDVSKIFTILDQQHDNHIDIDEFIKGCHRFKGHAKCIDMALLCSQVDKIPSKLDLIVEATFGNLMELCEVQVKPPFTSTPLKSAKMMQGTCSAGRTHKTAGMERKWLKRDTGHQSSLQMAQCTLKRRFDDPRQKQPQTSLAMYFSVFFFISGFWVAGVGMFCRGGDFRDWPPVPSKH